MAATVGPPAQDMSWPPSGERHPTLLEAASRMARSERGACENLGAAPELSLPGMVDLPAAEDAIGAATSSTHDPGRQASAGPAPPRPGRRRAEDECPERRPLTPCSNREGIARVCKQLLSGSCSGGVYNPYNVSALKSFLLDPVPEALGMVRCRVLRQGSGLNALFPKYALELDSAVLVLTAQKQLHAKACNYGLLLPEAVCPDQGEAERGLGRLNPDFCGLEFVGYGEGANPKKAASSSSTVGVREEMIAVQYNASTWGNFSPGVRHMTVTIPRVMDSERCVCRPLRPEAEGLLALKALDASCLVDVYHSRDPEHSPRGVTSLDFDGRVKKASTKGFQLVSSLNSEAVHVQFGRVGRGTFHLDFRHPFSPLQAFAACLSTFDFKLCCE